MAVYILIMLVKTIIISFYLDDDLYRNIYKMCLLKGVSMILKDASIGKRYIVTDLKVNNNIKRRLQSLGMIHDTMLTILNCKRNGSVIFSVRGTRLAVGRKISEKIIVRELVENE